MYNFSKETKENRKALFEFVASKKKLHASVIEKDFWVCILLDFLFNKSQYAQHMKFKGGTSLSKGYGLIERFSEDIDIVLSGVALSYPADYQSEDRSSREIEQFKKEIKAKNIDFLNQLKEEIEDKFCKEFAKGSIVKVNEESESIEFRYPAACATTKGILPFVKLEIGPLAEWDPSEIRTITPYVAEIREDLFKQKSTNVMTIKAIRTFWEKITILHKEANREDVKKASSRQSRHYYDVYRMAHNDVKTYAFQDVDLLIKDVDFVTKFYKQGWAKFDEITQGKVKLIPNNECLEFMKKDYETMKEMFFGEHPTFDEIIEYLKALENEINDIILKHLSVHH